MFSSTLTQKSAASTLRNNRNEVIARRRGNHWLSSSNQPIADSTIKTLSNKSGYKLS